MYFFCLLLLKMWLKSFYRKRWLYSILWGLQVEAEKFSLEKKNDRPKISHQLAAPRRSVISGCIETDWLVEDLVEVMRTFTYVQLRSSTEAGLGGCMSPNVSLASLLGTSLSFLVLRKEIPYECLDFHLRI
jgi:hypothetical protein